MKSLREIPCGQTAVVLKIKGEGPVKRRIMDMGITSGVEIYVRGYELSIRKADAECIEVR